MKKCIFPLKVTLFAYNEQHKNRPHMDFHSHNILELYYVAGGDAEIMYQADGEIKRMSIFTGQFVLIKPDLLHCINSECDLKYYVLEIDSSDNTVIIMNILNKSAYIAYFDEAAKLLKNFDSIILFNDTQNLIMLLEKFRSVDFSQDSVISQAMTEILLKQVFLSVIQCVNNKLNTIGHNIYIKKALSYIATNFRQDIKVCDIAQHVGVSAVHLQRIFSVGLKSSVSRTLCRLRINSARDMLLKTNDSITQIALLVGYKSLSVFETNFKRITGVSPNEFRRQSKNKIVRIIL